MKDKIIQIAIDHFERYNLTIYGLSKDGKVYVKTWHSQKGKHVWSLNVDSLQNQVREEEHEKIK